MTYVSPRDGRERAGVLRDGAIHGVSEPLLDLVAREALAAVVDPVEIVSQADARLRAPVPSPPSIRDFMAFDVRVEVERLGSLESTVHPAQPLHPL